MFMDCCMQLCMFSMTSSVQMSRNGNNETGLVPGLPVVGATHNAPTLIEQKKGCSCAYIGLLIKLRIHVY